MKIRSHADLDVYKMAFNAAQEIFRFSSNFPKEERYSLTDQIRRSSRSICANLAEAFRKRKYPKAFVSKLSDAEAEAAETQVWIHFAFTCNYLNKEDCEILYREYNQIIGKLVNMALKPESWAP